MPSPHPASDALFARAREVIPGGVNSPVRAFGSVGGTPRFVASASGAEIVDEDGARYLDLVQSWGPLPLGHSHPVVLEAARAALGRGSTFGAPTAAEVRLAELVRDAVPSIEKLRLTSSGTEAGMSAVRLARGATGRDGLLKFTGHYHGHGDALLAAAGSGVATLGAGRGGGRGAAGIPGSPGVTAGAAADTVLVPWNDREAVTAAVDRHGDDLAAIVCEPVAANMSLVPPAIGHDGDDFLAFLRAEADRSGALLVFDEVITGFRLARGGAQQVHGVTPDVTVLGKAIGGGFPLAGFGARAELMDQLAPDGPVYHAGTLSGNPVATAAGVAQLELLTDDVYARLDEITDRVATALRAAFADAGVDVVVRRHGTLAAVLFPPGADAWPPDGPHDYDQVRAADQSRYARFFHAMLDRGVYLAPSGFEILFTSIALEPHLDRLAETARAAAAAIGR